MKLNSSLITSAILLILAVIIISGCKGSKERNIAGAWQKVTFTTEEDTVIWSFYDNGRLYISKNNLVTDSADYALSSNVIEYFVIIEGFCRPEEEAADVEFNYASCDDGKYKIDELSNDVLKLLRLSNGDGSTDATFRYYEFTKRGK